MPSATTGSAGASAQRITLRPALPSDSDFLYQTFASTCDPHLPEAILPMQYKAFSISRSAQFPGASLLIAEIDGEPAGYCRTDDTQGCFRIVDFALLPGFRGHGAGTSILRMLLERVPELPVRLSVARSNPAQRLYARLGFHAIREDAVFVEMERK